MTFISRQFRESKEQPGAYELTKDRLCHLECHDDEKSVQSKNEFTGQ